MRKEAAFALVFLCLLVVVLPARGDEPPPVASEPAAATSDVVVTGRYDTADGRRVLTVWGTPRERGFAQGYLLAEPLLAGVRHDYAEVLTPILPLYEHIVRKQIIPQFSFSERELAEMEGIFAGVKARLPEESLQVPALGRAFDLLDVKALNTFGDWYGLGCSTLAVWGRYTKDGLPLVGRNFDFPGFALVVSHQHVVVRAAEGEARGMVGVGYPGSIGILTGMNADGVFVAVHDVRAKPTLDKIARPNIPRLLAVRRILEQTTGARACLDAHALAKEWPTLYGNNLMVVAPARADGVPPAAVLEYDARTDMDGGCTLRTADKGGLECVACTNHHLQRSEVRSPLPVKPRWRLPKLLSLAEERAPDKPLDVEAMFGWMEQTSFPREEKPLGLATGLTKETRAHGTLHQAVAVPGTKTMHVRLGIVGKRIVDVPARKLDVPALVQGAR